METLLKKAESIGVKQKIDPEELDPESIRKWDGVIDGFIQVKSLCDTLDKLYITKFGNTMLKCDASHFVNTSKIITDLIDGLHMDYTISNDIVETLESTIKYVSDQIDLVYTPNTAVTTNVEKDVFMIDTDVEFMEDGAKVLLYTRCIEDDSAMLAVCDFDDYFYVEISDKTLISTRKAILAIEKKLIWRYRCAKKEHFEKMSKECATVSSAPPDNDENAPKWAVEEDRVAKWRINTNKPLVKEMVIIKDHKTIYGYQEKCGMFLKVYTAYPTITRDIMKMVHKDLPKMKLFEANVPFIHKFLARNNLSGCCAMKVKGSSTGGKRLSTCDSQIKVSSIERIKDDAVIYEPINMYFDIEVLASDVNVFPTADLCPIFQFSYVVTKGTGNTITEGVLCLNETPGENYHSFDTEEQLLFRWYQLIIEYNVEVFITYNGDSFDFPYIFDRMDLLGISPVTKQFSRRLDFIVTHRADKRYSAQKGSYVVHNYIMPGRTSFDLLPYIRMGFKLDQYSLKHVATTWLNDTKEDLAYKLIPELFKTASGRSRIASYCMTDSRLLQQLDHKKLLGLNVAMMAATLGTSLTNTISRGIGFKLMRFMLDYTIREKYLIPTFSKVDRPKFEEKLQGAYVFDPRKGLYTNPIVVLDFGSLYPSIMRGWNLSYDTRVFDIASLPDPSIAETMPSGFTFVKEEFHEGLVPMIERELMAARNHAKKMKKKFPSGSIEANTWDSTQLAIKVACNSMYGILGSPTAMLPMLPIAQSITKIGQECLFRSRDYVEEHIGRITGRDDVVAKTIYGDTDSIFVELTNCTTQQALDYGKLIEEAIQRDIWDARLPMVLEMEKVYNPFCIVSKKRYMGQKFTTDANKGVSDFMGLSVTRRNSPGCLVDIMNGLIDNFCSGNIEAAVQHVETTLKRFWANELPIDRFILSNKLTKLTYDSAPAHLIVRNQISDKYGESIAPTVGERVQYVLIESDKRGAKIRDLALNMLTAREMGDKLKLNKEHYFKLIRTPMYDLLQYIIGEEKARKLLDTRTIEASGSNLLSFFGVKSITSTKRRKLI